MLCAMGVDWKTIENFFVDDYKLPQKINKTQEYFLKFRGLWNDGKKK